MMGCRMTTKKLSSYVHNGIRQPDLSWPALQRRFYYDREQLREKHTAPVLGQHPGTTDSDVEQALENVRRLYGAACTIRRR